MDPTMAAGFHLVAGDHGEANWGVTCSDHGLYRTGLYYTHAFNTMEKHRRDFHDQPWPDLNLSAVATLVCMSLSITDGRQGMVSEAVRDLWELLTGLEGDEAVALAERVQASREPITAHVAPF